MVDLRTREESEIRPPILEVLPAALSQDMSPQRCACRRRGSDLTEVQRAAHERVHEDWRIMRVQWCDAHGYQLAELLRAERAQVRRRR